MNHTKECIEQNQNFEAAKKRFLETYPNHCKVCKGYGGGEYAYDPSPSGVGLGSGTMWDYDPCAACAEKGICSLCAGKTDEDGVCLTGCEITKDHPGDGPECYCYELEALNPEQPYEDSVSESASTGEAS